MTPIDDLLAKLESLIRSGTFEQLESDALEIKPVPPTGGQWTERHRTINAFLNQQGGLLLLGIKEDQKASPKRYELTGYNGEPGAEERLKQLRSGFTDRDGRPVDVSDHVAFAVRDFMGGRIVLVRVDELPADRKFCFYNGEARERVLTGDHLISKQRIDAQEEFKQESLNARELKPIEGVPPEDLDLDRLNDYILRLNRGIQIETLKATLNDARPFLAQKSFVVDGKVTTLGMLVCGRQVADRLGLRSHVHGYVDLPQEIARDKQTIAGNILPVMDGCRGYILRNIQVGVSAAGGGTSVPQYPEKLLRETVNNALAHRDYAIDKQAIIAIKPGVHVSIQNPGAFRPSLLIQSDADGIPIRRIIPEAKPRNPKLAEVLHVFDKWEGRGIGMATLTDSCLRDETDLPSYELFTEEVCLYLRCGRLIDARMERLFSAYDLYLAEKLDGEEPTQSQLLVLAYLIKSERMNAAGHFTILLTERNNHYKELYRLQRAGIIRRHAASQPLHPVYVVERELMRENYFRELRTIFGAGFDSLNPLHRQVLDVTYRFNHFSRRKVVSAKQASYYLWPERGGESSDIRGFDAFYRSVRRAFVKLLESGFVRQSAATKGKRLYEYSPEPSFRRENLS